MLEISDIHWQVGSRQEHGLVHCVVFDLAENYLDKDHRIHFDNFYSTVKLMHENRPTYACGTIRSDRGRFLASFKEKLERGESKFLRISKLVTVHWGDKRDVYTSSTKKEKMEKKRKTEKKTW